MCFSPHSCDRPSATPFKVWIRRMTSPLFPSLCLLPWLKSGCWTGQPSSGILQHTSAAWRTGPSFVLQGFGGVRGSAYRHLLFHQCLYLCVDVVRIASSLKYVPDQAWMDQPHGCIHVFGFCQIADSGVNNSFQILRSTIIDNKQ